MHLNNTQIVTIYVFRIACSVRACTENINQSALFCFLLLVFVCQSSFSFSFSSSFFSRTFVFVYSLQLVSTPIDPTSCCFRFVALSSIRFVLSRFVSFKMSFQGPKLEPTSSSAAVASSEPITRSNSSPPDVLTSIYRTYTSVI